MLGFSNAIEAKRSPPNSVNDAGPNGADADGGSGNSSNTCVPITLLLSSGLEDTGVAACSRPGQELDEFRATDLSNACDGLGVGIAVPNALEGDASGLADCGANDDCPEQATC